MPVKEGRKLVFTPDEIEQAEKLSSVLNQQQMAEFFGVSERKFKDAKKDQPELGEAYSRGRSKALARVGGGLLQKALEGNLTAQIFYLKTQGGWREKDRVELTGKDGGPIATKDLTDDPVGIISRRIAGIAARLGATEIAAKSDGERRQLPPP